ncbi:phosphoribosylaminoimidazolesuccinocarboxamide synthase [Sulfurimonas sp.]|uniref:phosphoribosylaminoimidazolesuccinocarboxamide synthase n=1 Tax=Sulfurimonas sp. TaxID=2022749 RepID=UPI003D13B08E
MKTECDYLLDICSDLELDVKLNKDETKGDKIVLLGPKNESITVDFTNTERSLIEQVLSQIDIEFETLPLFVQGDSKEIRLLTPKIALARLVPSVYSYTYNRYGMAPGTDEVRARFSADIFRKMNDEPGPYRLASAFLGLIDTKDGVLLAEQVVQTCNLEVRVKRFHIGSPLHRYLYIDNHSTSENGPPLQRWSKFEKPVVCFDWRHPLHDEDGKRLADEPLPDDYAALWLDNIEAAKKLARDTFLWLEQKFAAAGLLLVDICFFIDRTGQVLYGEISPDCMRIRDGTSTNAAALDKDVWRSGGKPEEVLANYMKLYELVFGKKPY